MTLCNLRSVISHCTQYPCQASIMMRNVTSVTSRQPKGMNKEMKLVPDSVTFCFIEVCLLHLCELLAVV